jgi:phage host-nuclease inhibitor protein Gam
MNKTTSPNTEAQTDFARAVAKLDSEIARFEAAVQDFCEAKKEFLANL